MKTFKKFRQLALEHARNDGYHFANKRSLRITVLRYLEVYLMNRKQKRTAKYVHRENVRTLITMLIAHPDFNHLNTDEIAKALITIVRYCDEIYFEPLVNKKANGEIPFEYIAVINKLTIELTNRYLLMGF
jgi:hypothetical protein